jgi:hypothetical protein
VERNKRSLAHQKNFYDIGTSVFQDACEPGSPARLPLDKLKLHYVVHFLYTGIWDHIVPEVDAADMERIECYICNFCHKRFKNMMEKKEYPGKRTLSKLQLFLINFHIYILDKMPPKT